MFTLLIGDTETTGFDRDNDYLAEIFIIAPYNGVIDFHIFLKVPTNAWDKLNNNKSFPTAIKLKQTCNPDNLESKEPREAFLMLNRWLSQFTNPVLMFHNVDFDRAFIENTVKK